jgi:CRP-like cAMP-binding protein
MLKKLFNFIFIDEKLKSAAAFLKDVALFGGLPSRALTKIALIEFAKNYNAGEIIYTEKQEANVVYVIKSGSVELQYNGQQRVVEEGDFFGEISLLGERRHDSTAKALKPCELYLLYRIKIEDVVASDPKIGFRIMRNLASIFAARLKCSEI